MPDYDSEFRRIQSILGWLKTELAQMKSSKPLVGEGLAPGPWTVHGQHTNSIMLGSYYINDANGRQVVWGCSEDKTNLNFICMARDQAGKEQKVSLDVIDFLTNAIKVYEAQWEDLEATTRGCGYINCSHPGCLMLILHASSGGMYLEDWWLCPEHKPENRKLSCNVVLTNHGGQLDCEQCGNAVDVSVNGLCLACTAHKLDIAASLLRQARNHVSCQKLLDQIDKELGT